MVWPMTSPLPRTDLPFSPAAERNQHAILDTLRRVLPPQGHALEVASGTGQHAACFAHGLPGWLWQPTDFNADLLPAIAARVVQAGLANVRPPLRLDVLAPPWTGDGPTFDAIFCANMLHISPWATCAALMQLAARLLAPGGQLVVYGPFLEDGVPTSPGNLAFDHSLRTQDPAWGVRHLGDVTEQAHRVGLRLTQRHAMPANNLLLVWAQTDNPAP